MSQEPMWYYMEGNEVRGPVAVAHLRQMARGGQIAARTLVCREGTQDWVEASRLRLEFVPPLMSASAGPPANAAAPAASPARTPVSAASPGGEHNLFSPAWLLDYRFQKFVTPQIVQAVWILWLVFGSLSALIYFGTTLFGMFHLPPSSWMIPIAFLLGSLLGLLVATLMLRVWLEFLINIFHWARQPPR